MDVTWIVKYITEFLGTAILIILGNGAVANVELKGTKGHQSGWLVIAVGYGMGVMIPALMFGNVSGNHINPAFTLGLAISGYFPWVQVVPYIIAQLLGAMFGQALVVASHRPYYLQTTNPNAILGSFSTIVNTDDGSKQSHAASMINGFINEFIGSFVLFFAAMAMTTNYFGAEVIKYAATRGVDATLGGPTGPGLNPARDLGPRILHFLLPKSVLGEHKGDSKWWYAWVPVVSPILAGIVAVALYKLIYG